MVAGGGPSAGFRATMIEGNTSASSKICLAWPKSTTDSTQAFLGEEPPQRLAVGGLHPFVRDDEREPAAGPEQAHPKLVEVDVEVGHAVIGRVPRLQVRLDRREPFLADVGRVADHDVEAAAAPFGLEDLGEFGLASRMPSGRSVLSATMLLPTRRLWSRLVSTLPCDGRLDPEAELGDVDGLLVEVHAVEVLLEDLAVQVEKLGESPQLSDAVVGPLICGVELVEGLDQERPAAARRVEDPDRAQLMLPVEPEREQRIALRGP